MLEREIPLEEVLLYAEAAKRYAQTQIKKGSSQLENNNLSEEYFDALRMGVGGKDGIGIRNISKQEMESELLEKNEYVTQYESYITVSSKYSLGNCWELALQALDYILTSLNSDINAEVYRIHGGDHIFLVLNRNQDSDPQDPATWGNNAVICDPWADKVYKASEYASELKNFYRQDGKNCVEDFDTTNTRHILAPRKNYNTQFLRRNRTIPNLKAAFIEESNHLLEILTYYKTELEKEEKRLKKNHAHQNKKVVIISEKIKLIDQSIRSTNDVVKNFISEDYENDYRLAKSELIQGLGDLTKNALLAISFSKEDRDKLFEYDPDPRQKHKTGAMKFLGVRPKTQSRLEDITKEVNVRFAAKKKP